MLLHYQSLPFIRWWCPCMLLIWSLQRRFRATQVYSRVFIFGWSVLECYWTVGCDSGLPYCRWNKVRHGYHTDGLEYYEVCGLMCVFSVLTSQLLSFVMQTSSVFAFLVEGFAQVVQSSKNVVARQPQLLEAFISKPIPSWFSMRCQAYEYLHRQHGVSMLL